MCIGHSHKYYTQSSGHAVLGAYSITHARHNSVQSEPCPRVCAMHDHMNTLTAHHAQGLSAGGALQPGPGTLATGELLPALHMGYETAPSLLLGPSRMPLPQAGPSHTLRPRTWVAPVPAASNSCTAPFPQAFALTQSIQLGGRGSRAADSSLSPTSAERKVGIALRAPTPFPKGTNRLPPRACQEPGLPPPLPYGMFLTL